MHQQQCQQPLTVPYDEPAQPPRRSWHQPRFERLPVSLDTALSDAFGNDGGSPGANATYSP